MHAGERSNIPPEVLDRVFKHCERVFKNRGFDGPVFAPKSRLHPLLFVCREWHDIAERRLYSSVSLGSDRIVKDRNGKKMEIRGRDVCKRFRDTVQSSPRLASLVRELHLGTKDKNVEETELHICLIDVCKNVEIVEVYGVVKSLANDLKESLAKADLVSLDLSSCALGDYGSGREAALFSLSEFITLLQNWPRIEKVYASFGDDRSHGGDATMNPSASTTSQTSCCPALRIFAMYGVTFTPTHLSRLADISPRLERLSIRVRNNSSAALQQCLEVWSSSLKYLTIFTPLYDNPWTGGACSIIRSPMIELREVHLSYPMVTPEDMVFLPKLEKLTFRGEYSHGVELARLIRSGGLPCVSDIDVMFSKSKSEDISEEDDDRMCVEIAKEIRHVCRKRRIFVEDAFTVVEELEERYGYIESDEESLDNDWSYFDEEGGSSGPPPGDTFVLS